jgi:hypothetical protein
VRTLVAGTIALLVGFPPSSHAHELDEYLQAARVSLARDHVVCEIDLTPGAGIAAEIVALVDRDADRLVSPAEAEAYGRAVLSDVRLEVDGRAITMTLTRVDVPSVEEMTDGVGTIRLEAITSVDPLAAGRRHVYFRNDHHPDAAVYLVNALVPEQREIMVVGQTRDPRQHAIRLEYDVTSAAFGQLAWLVLGSAALSALVAWRIRSTRHGTDVGFQTVGVAISDGGGRERGVTNRRDRQGAEVRRDGWAAGLRPAMYREEPTITSVVRFLLTLVIAGSSRSIPRAARGHPFRLSRS